MAVLAIFHARGVSKAAYETLRKEVDWEHKIAPGGIFHAAGFDSAGDAHVADVWESRTALDAFPRTRLAPAFEELGMPLPQAQVFELHNATAYSAVDRYKV